MKDKIQKLLDQIKRDFPDGCSGVICGECCCNGAECNTVEWYLCGILHDALI